jgi:hypothetical protein
MAQFTTSAKPIQYYRESTLINKFALAVGDRCERLTQSERYQLATVIGLFCHAYCELEEDDEMETLLEVYNRYIAVPFSGNVCACLFLFKDEDPGALAAILPAITEYAQNEYVEEDTTDDGTQLYDGDLVLTPLVPHLEGASI